MKDKKEVAAEESELEPQEQKNLNSEIFSNLSLRL